MDRNLSKRLAEQSIQEAYEIKLTAALDAGRTYGLRRPHVEEAGEQAARADREDVGRGKDVTLRPFLMFRVPLRIHYKAWCGSAVMFRTLESFAETVDS